MRDVLKYQHPAGHWSTHTEDAGVGFMRAGPHPTVWNFVRSERIGRGKVPISALPKGGYSPMRHRDTWYLGNWFDLPLEE